MALALGLTITACAGGRTTIDTDGDGAGLWDNCPAVVNPDQSDLDADGLGDACDGCLSADAPEAVCALCALVPNSDRADEDGDGVPDACDNCPGVPNPGQLDQNTEVLGGYVGVGDACDADGDDVDVGDNCAAVANIDQVDSDTDGRGDACDTDDDGDGWCDPGLAAPACVGADNCPLVGNGDQLDTDADLIGDICDLDDDGDLVDDFADNCPSVANADQADAEGDGVGDVCDDDLDGDGVSDAIDNCLGYPNATQSDQDTDGQGDTCDADVDGDLVPNDADNCAGLGNPSQADRDGDGAGDACDDDRDGDGLDNGADNCAEVANPVQENLDADPLGDACDPDLDGDGVDNGSDNCPRVSNGGQADGDFDGLGDACDLNVDSDGDAVDDGIDNCLAVRNGDCGIDPLRCDVDNSGGASAAEIALGDQIDADADGVGDACDGDRDGDGLDNGIDKCPDTFSLSNGDQDGDGVGDICDADRDNDGHANASDNCPDVANVDQSDADGDLVGDACDGDRDGDSVANTADNCVGVANPTQLDADADTVGSACDNCPLAPNVLQEDVDVDGVGDACDNCVDDPNAGQADVDGDGIGDACDPQEDYDGLIMLRHFKPFNWVDAGAIFSDRAAWPAQRNWFDYFWFGSTRASRPSVPLVWERDVLIPPYRDDAFPSYYAGPSIQLALVGGPQPIVLPWDVTTMPNTQAYVTWSTFPNSRWVYNASYTLSAGGGPNVPPDIGPFTLPSALTTPSDFVLSPDGFANPLVVNQDVDFVFTWTPGPASGTRVDFYMLNEHQVLSYWADDAAGTLTIPVSELAQLRPGPAQYFLIRQVESAVSVGGKRYYVASYLEDEGYMWIIPPCSQSEVEANESISAANVVVGNLSAGVNVCGAYGTRQDRDYFQFSANAGELLFISTIAEFVGSNMDTYIELFDGAGTLLLENDDAAFQIADSSLTLRAPATGVYYVMVRHRAANAQGSPAHTYNLLLGTRAVTGQPFVFPNTSDGGAPDAACAEVPDGPGWEFIEGDPATCVVDVAGVGSVSKVKLFADIWHTYSVDLRVEIEHGGITVVLDDHAGKVHGVFGEDYSVDDPLVTLDAFLATDPNGPWTVRVTDWLADDLGRVRSLVLFFDP